MFSLILTGGGQAGQGCSVDRQSQIQSLVLGRDLRIAARHEIVRPAPGRPGARKLFLCRIPQARLFVRKLGRGKDPNDGSSSAAERSAVLLGRGRVPKVWSDGRAGQGEFSSRRLKFWNGIFLIQGITFAKRAIDSGISSHPSLSILGVMTQGYPLNMINAFILSLRDSQ